MSNLLLDAKLNQASYGNAYHNKGTGDSISGWRPVEVVIDSAKQLTTNFSAQLFKSADGTYKLAFRGTELEWNPTDLGDAKANTALALGYWSPEFTDDIRFTHQAIQAIMTETGKGYDYARGLLSVTGHSQGGAEAELVAKFFGLGGTSLDGPGVKAQVGSAAWGLLKAELRRQQPELQANYTLTDFTARRYTFLVGTAGHHLSDVQQDNAALWLIGQALPMLTGPLGVGISLGAQAAGFHSIQNIVDWEAARDKSSILRRIGLLDDPTGLSLLPQNVAATISGEMNRVNVAGEAPPLDFSELEARSAQITEFLVTHPGEIQYRINNGAALIEAGNGDTLLLRQDGSGMRLVQDGLGGLVQENLGLNGVILESMALAPLSDTETLVTVTSAGQTITKVVSTQNDGSLGVEERDTDGNLLTESTVRALGTDENGQPRYGLDQTRYAGGQVQSTSISNLTPAGQLQMTVERQIDGHTVQVEFIEDEWGELQASRVISVDGQAIDGGGTFDDILNYQGYDAWAFADGATPTGSPSIETLFQAYNPLEKQGLQTLVSALTRTADALSLLAAIQSGKPLPLLASGLRLANTIPGAANDAAAAGFNLSGVSNAVGGVLSLMSLDAAVKNGDTIGAITAGAQALSFGAGAYVDFAAQNVLTATTFEATAAAHAAFDGAAGLQQSVGKALPALNIINSLAHGDYVGAGINTLALMNPVFAPVAVAYTVFNLIKGLFGGDDEPRPWASGRWGWNAQGQLVPQVSGGDGGEATLNGLMGQLQGILGQLATQSGNGLGLIPERLPGLSFQNNTFHLSDLDYASGAEALPEVRYTTAGQPYNAPAGSNEGYWSLSERFVRVALEHGAIAPQWEADTARLQSANRLNDAGLTEEDRAAKAGKLVAPATGASQAFRPVILDLDGDGIALADQAHSGVAFDVDDSGYLKATGWLTNEGADTDGFLWLDRNWNGAIDSGSELFSNAQVQAGSRGVPSLDWVDADGDGRITAADPVWSQLKVWKDANGNGQGEAGEVWALDGLGIGELDYAHGRYTIGGQTRQLASPEIVADTAGTRTHVIPEGILVETTDHGISLIATRVDDLSALEANRDGVTGFEDVELIVSGTDLLANDTLGGAAGPGLTITALTNFRNGSGWLDGNGFVHFMPTADFNGLAGFDYSVAAPGGQTGTAGVDITIQGVNDAPTVV
ncbi:MAG: cadherin-like domain-containing protein, partial [Gallionellaceae bacterium]|nr:cadherin-like domain-containing protein [Gallionellaceae bacterium]